MRKYTNNEIFESMMRYGIIFWTTCVSDESKIIESVVKNGVRFSYRKAVKLIKEHDRLLFEYLMLELRNPWSNNTYVSKDGIWLIITHSAIEYAFRLCVPGIKSNPFYLTFEEDFFPNKEVLH